MILVDDPDTLSATIRWTTNANTTALSPNTLYPITVEAINQYGSGGPSTKLDATTSHVAVAPPKPTVAIVSVATDPNYNTHFEIKWTATTDDNNSTVTGYKILWKNNNTDATLATNYAEHASVCDGTAIHEAVVATTLSELACTVSITTL